MNKGHVNVTLVAAIAAALALPMSVSVAVAQGAVIAVAQEQGLEEVIVTARKREERMQDVAVAVSAMNTTELERRFSSDLQGFANAAPNVIIDDLQQGPGSPAAIAIRGIGATDVEKNFDPTVGVVLDGIFIGSNSGSMIKALDLQGMEILRGPQGTLFGRNAIAGVINVTRRRPNTEALGGQVRLGYGNYNDMAADGYLNVPVGDTFAFKVNAAYHSNDGYVQNTTLHRTTGDLEYKTGGVSFLWKPTEAIDLYYRYDKGDQTQDTPSINNNAQPNQVFCFFYQQCAVNVHTPQAGDPRKSVSNGFDSNAFFKTDMHVFDATWRVAEGYQLDYLFGYFKTDEEVYQDWDGTPLTLYHTDRPAKYDQQSHELRLTHASDSKLSYTVGMYYWDSKYRIDLLSYIGFIDFLCFANGGDAEACGPLSGFVANVPQSVEQTTKSYAGFFEADWAFTDALKLTVGGRYTNDKKESGVEDPAFQDQLDTLGGSFSHPFHKSWSEFTPKVNVSYKFTPDVMGYALYTRGFRAGGFSGRPGTYQAAGTAYNPETVDNFELGMKSEWMDHRVRFNAAAYFMKYNDKQEEQSYPLSSGTGQQTLVLNASSAELKGAEFELLVAPVDGLTIAATLGLLDAKYKNFTDPVSGADLTKYDLRRAPKFNWTLEPIYTWPMLGGDVTARASWHYVDTMQLTFFNSKQTENGPQDIVDASLSYLWKNTMVNLYGTNLTNDNSNSVGFDVGASTSFAGLWSYTAVRPPRLYGIQLSQKF